MTPFANDLPHQPPYRDLFIYYLEGRVAPAAFVNDKAFVGNWEEGPDTFLFFSQPRKDAVHAYVAHNPQLVLVDDYHMTYAQWQGGLPQPFQVGRLRVVPPWHNDARQNQAGQILLDPGVVFGTGTHRTTFDCLQALQCAFDTRPVQYAVDLGTGTGLLALAAVKLGARRCIAVDLNLLAAQTTMRNVQYNDMLKQVLVVQGDAKKYIDLPCDLMISNIHYDIMRHLVAAPGFRQIKQFVLSGLLRSQAYEIEQLLKRGAAKILHQWAQDGIWHTFFGQNT